MTSPQNAIGGSSLLQLISGLLVMGYLVAALFFLKFQRDTRDRLFGFFAAAFFILAIQRLGLTFVPAGMTGATWLYLLRAAAFGLILFGIMDKNRAHR